MAFNVEDLKRLTVAEPTSAAFVPTTDADRLIGFLASEANITADQATLAIAIICQKGGTSKKAQGTIFMQ